MTQGARMAVVDGRRGQRECRLGLAVDSAAAGQPSSQLRKRPMSPRQAMWR